LIVIAILALLLYCVEVWTGSEYQVAAHCLREGLTDEGHAVLDALWARYDGRRRNPFNQIECGDHYVRSMAGWSVLDALTGFSCDGVRGRLTFRHPDAPGRPVPFLAIGGWGTWSVTDAGLVLECRGGRVDVRELVITGPDVPGYASAGGGTVTRNASGIRIVPASPITVGAGERLVLAAQPE
jgi:hypothetical protein